jgi:hypothetical protein
VLERAAAAGRKVGLLSERPGLDHWQAFAWRAFNELHSCRSYGFGGVPGPIPWTAIRQWASEHGVTDPDEFDDLVYLTFELDGAWREAEAEAVEKAADRTGRV